ncbi:MAG TPA: ABC transporter permease subunit [Gemmatimonadales bacterium]
MIATLFARNLRHQIRLLAALLVGLAAIEVIFVQVMASFDQSTGLGNLVELLPSTMRDLFGAQLAFASFPSALAFGYQHPVVLVGALAFVVLVATIPAGERETGMLELLLARPVPRARYLAGVLWLVVLGAVVLPAALLAGGMVGLAMVAAPDVVPWTRYLSSAMGMMALLLAFGGIALLFAAGARRRGPAVARTLGLVLTLYLVEVLGGLWSVFGAVQWASPFHYFKPIDMVMQGGNNPSHVLVLLSVFGATTGAAFWRFTRSGV